MTETQSHPLSPGPEAGWALRSLRAVDDPRVRIDRLVPLLHELVACGLVMRDEDGGFVLRQDVQDRLALLTSDRPDREAQVYVGRKCQQCGRVALTRTVGDTRICSACHQAAVSGIAATAEPAAAIRHARRGILHRHRPAS